MRNFDLIIYGATGFTGRYVVQRLAETVLKEKGSPKKWAVAVRNVPKMKEYLAEIEQTTQISGLAKSVTVLEADVKNGASMRRAFSQGKLVMNCIGPYSLLGEPVVKACIDSRTHLMDLSGEPLFLEKMEQKYDKAAGKAGIYVVGSCGFDSIPSDIGVQLLKHRFQGTVDQIEHLLEVYCEKNHFSYATWLSLIEGFRHQNDLKKIRKEIFSKYPTFKWIQPQKRLSLRKVKNGYVIPFPGSDRSVVKRTQMYRHAHFGEYPSQFEAYFRVENLKQLLGLFFMHTNMNLWTKSEFGVKLLEKYSLFFSLGAFKKGEMPDRKSLEKNRTFVTLVGKGWPKTVRDGERNAGNMSKQSAVIMNCGDGAYIETAIIAIHTAFTLLDAIQMNESGKASVPHGVITPGSIINCEDLVARLNNENVKFHFIEDFKY